MMKNSSKVVLVVEDNATNMKLFRDLLKVHGYNVLQANDGRLKDDETLKSIPIVAVTAFVLGGDEEKMLDAGCDGFILKPISVLSFMETIDRFVADQGPNPAKCELETA